MRRLVKLAFILVVFTTQKIFLYASTQVAICPALPAKE
jgi:hypothetical protein